MYTIAVSGLDSVLIDKFPEYVRDMMQNKDKMKAEFKVYYMFIFVRMREGGWERYIAILMYILADCLFF